MPTNYETLRTYAEAYGHYIVKTVDEAHRDPSPEDFFAFLHKEYEPPKPKPLTIPQRRAADIAAEVHAIALRLGGHETPLKATQIVLSADWRSWCERYWLDPENDGLVKSALQLLDSSGLAAKTVACGPNARWTFLDAEPDDAYRAIAASIRAAAATTH